jgi:DNA-binding SARP family transcriptional activator
MDNETGMAMTPSAYGAGPGIVREASVAVTVRVLGGFTVRIGDREIVSEAWPRREAAAVVKLLALSPQHTVHRERLMNELWPDAALTEAAPRLHKAAHYARRVLGRPDAVVLRGSMVSLFPGQQVTVDVDEFAAATERAVAGGSAAEAAAVLDRFPGELLPADTYESWVAARGDRVTRDRAVLLRQAQRWDELLELDPTDEQVHVALMQALLAAGDHPAVLRQFDRLDSTLRRELGVGPGPEAVRVRDRAAADMRKLGTLTAAGQMKLDQRIRFCRSADGVTLAYATAGTGFPLVKTANWMTHLDYDWHSPVWRHWLTALSGDRQLVRYDERGCGLSDWEIPPPTFGDWLLDLETVVDAAGLDRFDLLGGACHIICVRTWCLLTNSTVSQHDPSWEVCDENIHGFLPAVGAGSGFAAPVA